MPKKSQNPEQIGLNLPSVPNPPKVKSARTPEAERRKAERDAHKENTERAVVKLKTEANHLFARWQEWFDRKQSGWTKTRRIKVSEALDRFGYETCERVLRIAANDPNTRGQNKLNRPFDDLVNIFRNEERVEMYLRMGNLQGRNASSLTPHDGATRSEWVQ